VPDSVATPPAAIGEVTLGFRNAGAVTTLSTTSLPSPPLYVIWSVTTPALKVAPSGRPAKVPWTGAGLPAEVRLPLLMIVQKDPCARGKTTSSTTRGPSSETTPFPPVWILLLSWSRSLPEEDWV